MCHGRKKPEQAITAPSAAKSGSAVSYTSTQEISVSAEEPSLSTNPQDEQGATDSSKGSLDLGSPIPPDLSPPYNFSQSPSTDAASKGNAREGCGSDGEDKNSDLSNVEMSVSGDDSEL